MTHDELASHMSEVNNERMYSLFVAESGLMTEDQKAASRDKIFDGADFAGQASDSDDEAVNVIDALENHEADRLKEQERVK